MARSNGSVSTVNADGTTKSRVSNTIAFAIPQEYKDKLKEAAGEKSLSDYVRSVVAEKFGWTLPVQQRGRRGQYAGMSAEQKTAAKKAAYAAKQAKIKALLALYESGQISPDLVASATPAVEAEAPAEAAA